MPVSWPTLVELASRLHAIDTLKAGGCLEYQAHRLLADAIRTEASTVVVDLGAILFHAVVGDQAGTFDLPGIYPVREMLEHFRIPPAGRDAAVCDWCSDIRERRAIGEVGVFHIGKVTVTLIATTERIPEDRA